MTLPGESDEREVKKLLKRLIDGQEESLKFAVVARGPRDGQITVSRKQKLKRKDVLAAAVEDARQESGGKAPKLDVIAGQCRPLEPGSTTLRLMVEGKAAARAVACLEYLLTRGPYKTVGFTDVLLEEVDETDDDTSPDVSAPRNDAPPPPDAPPVPPPPPPSTSTPRTEQSGASPDSSSSSATANQFKQRLAALVSPIKAAAGTPDGEAARLKASQAGVLARQQKLDAAHKLLDEVDEHLRKAAAQTTDREALQAFTQRLKPLIFAAREVDSTLPGRAALVLIRQAGELAQDRQFDAAQKLLDQVETLIAQGVAAQSSGVSPEETARQEARAEQFQQDWAAARRTLRKALDDVQSQLEKLAQALLRSNDPNMIWIAEEGLTQLLGRLRATAANIDRLANKKPGKVASFAKPQLDELARQLDSPQVRMCDQNQFGVPVRIRRTLEQALDQMLKTLESAV